MGRMNRIVSFDEASSVLVCEAGCILEALDEWLAHKGHMMPLDLGAKGSCMIGARVLWIRQELLIEALV
jgi:FAD/FMN-containing dehydrogenase